MIFAVMFLHLSVSHSVHWGAYVAKGGTCLAKGGGMHGEGGHAWQRGACVVKEGHAW